MSVQPDHFVVVERIAFEGDEIQGVYDSETKAMQYVTNHSKGRVLNIQRWRGKRWLKRSGSHGSEPINSIPEGESAMNTNSSSTPVARHPAWCKCGNHDASTQEGTK